MKFYDCGFFQNELNLKIKEENRGGIQVGKYFVF